MSGTAQTLCGANRSEPPGNQIDGTLPNRHGRPLRSRERPYAEQVDHIAPTDAELQSMTDEEILGPPEGATVDDLAGRYPIELAVFGANSRRSGSVRETRTSWIRLLAPSQDVGHMPPKYVKPFIKRAQ